MDDVELTEHVIVTRSRPRDDWDVNTVIFVEANEIVQRLRRDGALPQSVSGLFHQLTWHCGVHTARWICDNKALLTKYADYDALTEAEKQHLRNRVIESIESALRRH